MHLVLLVAVPRRGSFGYRERASEKTRGSDERLIFSRTLILVLMYFRRYP